MALGKCFSLANCSIHCFSPALKLQLSMKGHRRDGKSRVWAEMVLTHSLSCQRSEAKTSEWVKHHEHTFKVH